jgi:hypothetical protein
MLAIDNKVAEVAGASLDGLSDDILTSTTPLVLKNLVSEWPLVKAGMQSSDAAINYICGYYKNAAVGAFFGDADMGGRVFYNDDMSGFNYKLVMMSLDAILQKLQRHAEDEKPPGIYLGSTAVDTCLPGLRDDNDINFGGINPLVSIWIGNRTRVAAHYDFPENIACNVVGHRRFTLFPPQELENLYVGPLDFTPAGQSISLVDFQNPDYKKFPRFEKALQSAQLAELGPGDAIFIPSTWWHHVEALDSINVLINYWWRRSPAYMGLPLDALMHALLAIRDLPNEQRKVWQGIFEHYVFNVNEDTAGYIPEHRRGILSPITEQSARELRAQLLNRLNR